MSSMDLMLEPMPMCTDAVAPAARPRSSWLRVVSPTGTGLGLGVATPAYVGASTAGIEINAKAHVTRRPPETST